MHAWLDKKRLELWIESERDGTVKAIKKKLINNLNYISADQFDKTLKNITQLTFKKFDGKYAVLFDFKPHSSKRWVYHQIKKHLPLKASLTSYYHPKTEPFLKYPTIKKLLKKDIKTVLVFDDASYSGMQLISKIIDPFKIYYEAAKKNIDLFLIVPYITNHAKTQIDAKSKSSNVKVHLIYGEKMKTVQEILTKNELNILKNLPELASFRRTVMHTRYDRVTLTYFDHRISDAHSFYEEISSMMKHPTKPYGENTDYGREEKKEWDKYWATWMNHN